VTVDYVKDLLNYNNGIKLAVMILNWCFFCLIGFTMHRASQNFGFELAYKWGTFQEQVAAAKKDQLYVALLLSDFCITVVSLSLSMVVLPFELSTLLADVVALCITLSTWRLLYKLMTIRRLIQHLIQILYFGVLSWIVYRATQNYHAFRHQQDTQSVQYMLLGMQILSCVTHMCVLIFGGYLALTYESPAQQGGIRASIRTNEVSLLTDKDDGGAEGGRDSSIARDRVLSLHQSMSGTPGSAGSKKYLISHEQVTEAAKQNIGSYVSESSGSRIGNIRRFASLPPQFSHLSSDGPPSSE